MRREGDQLWGRGAVDAKGPLACFVSAAVLAEFPAGWRLTVIGAVGEESDARGARYLAGRALQGPRLSASHPAGNRSRWATRAAPGWIMPTGAPITHGAAREQNACQSAIDLWNRLWARCQDLNTVKERVFDQLIPYMREMSTHSDGFTESANFKLNFRLPPGVGYEAMQYLLAEAAGEDENASFHLHHFDLAYQGEKNSPLVRAFLPAIRKQGGRPAFVFKSGTSDMNVVGPAWQCPILAYGPGDSSLDHTANEHILISEYLKGIQVLKQAIQAVCAAGQPASSTK